MDCYFEAMLSQVDTFRVFRGMIYVSPDFVYAGGRIMTSGPDLCMPSDGSMSNYAVPTQSLSAMMEDVDLRLRRAYMKMLPEKELLESFGVVAREQLSVMVRAVPENGAYRTRVVQGIGDGQGMEQYSQMFADRLACVDQRLRRVNRPTCRIVGREP